MFVLKYEIVQTVSYIIIRSFFSMVSVAHVWISVSPWSYIFPDIPRLLALEAFPLYPLTSGRELVGFLQGFRFEGLATHVPAYIVVAGQVGSG